MIKIKLLLKNVRIILKKKESGLRAPFLFLFNNKMEHPHVKCSLLLLTVLITSKLAPKKLLSNQKFMCQVTNTT